MTRGAVATLLLALLLLAGCANRITCHPIVFGALCGTTDEADCRALRQACANWEIPR